MSAADTIKDIMSRTGLNYSEVASAAGVSPATTRAVMLTGELPERQHPRCRLERFAALNAGAQRRGDVRFVDAEAGR
jgi:hypothetical protein